MGGTSVRDPWMRAAALRVLPVRLIASRAKRPVSGLRFRPAQTSGVPTPTWAPAFPDRPRAHELPIRTAMTLGAAGNEMDDYPIDEEKVMAGKDDRIAPAVTAAVEMGFAAVMSDYALCPQVTVPEITAASRATVDWVYRNAERLNGDRERIFVAGHSGRYDQDGHVAGWQYRLVSLHGGGARHHRAAQRQVHACDLGMMQ